MAKNYRDFKKQLEMKKEQAETLRMLNSAVSTLSKKRDSYIEQAKTAKRLGNMSQYNAMVALLKNAMFNLAQAQDMVANFTIAKDMCEMQQINKKFVKSLDSVMKNVHKTCKAINVSSSEKTFMKALCQQNVTSMQLRQALQDNNAAFSSSVDTISDISDEDVSGLLNDGINGESQKIDSTLEALELEFSAPSASSGKEGPAREMDSMGMGFGGNGQSASNGNGFAPNGNGFAPNGNGFAPNGNGFAPNGNGFAPNGNGFAPNGNGFAPNGNGFAPNGNGFAPNGNGFAPNGNGFAPNGNGSAPSGNAPAPSGNNGSAPSGNDANKPPVIPSTKKEDKKPDDKKNAKPEDKILGANGEELGASSEFKFNWESLPSIGFDDIAGLEDVKDIVRVKVLLPLKNPEAFEGYEKKSGGGMCLYGPPGTGKTMIAAAIANEIGAKFCSIKPSDLLMQGLGQTEKAVKALFAQARQFPCAVIYFDEMDSLTPKNTKSTAARQLRSEFLAQLQGIDSYKEGEAKILFLVAATNKPWDIDSAFLRPGRFGTKVYVGLPDAPAREYMIRKRIEKILKKGVVEVRDDVNVEALTENTNGYNCSDISNLLDRIEEISIIRGIKTGEKYIADEDFTTALSEIHSSVQADDIQKLRDWREENDQ